MCCRVPVSSCKLFSFISRGIDEEIGGRGWKSSGNQTAIAWATLISKKPGFEKLPCFRIDSSRLFIYLFIYLLCLFLPVVLIFLLSWSVIKCKTFRAISPLKSRKSTGIILKRNFVLQSLEARRRDKPDLHNISIFLSLLHHWMNTWPCPTNQTHVVKRF